MSPPAAPLAAPLSRFLLLLLLLLLLFFRFELASVSEMETKMESFFESASRKEIVLDKKIFLFLFLHHHLLLLLLLHLACPLPSCPPVAIFAQDKEIFLFLLLLLLLIFLLLLLLFLAKEIYVLRIVLERQEKSKRLFIGTKRDLICIQKSPFDMPGETGELRPEMVSLS